MLIAMWTWEIKINYQVLNSESNLVGIGLKVKMWKFITCNFTFDAKGCDNKYQKKTGKSNQKSFD